MQAVVTSWVAQELELQCPDENIGYWAQIQGQDSAMPRVAITLTYDGTEWTLQRASWPPRERGPGGVRAAVYRGVQVIRRYYTERDSTNA
jgi:hypothetical protein